MDANKIFAVKNRSTSFVVYNIPEENIRREFAPGEVKQITYGELEKLGFQQGGRELMLNFLQLQKEEATSELGIKREPEYDMNEQQVIELILNGAQDVFLDALDFAPVGVLDLIKKFAVELPMRDLMKVQALKEKTGFDVNAALANMAKEKEDEPELRAATAPTRRVKTAEGERRTTPKYNVVSK